jgi:hypothetical protein
VVATAGRSATITWSGIAGADRYRIYRGASATAQSVYLETPSNATSFTYTGVSERSGAPPTAATMWTVKNIFELKNAQYVTVEGNIFENVWRAGQYGYALVLTPRNSGDGAPWVRVRDVMFRNNIVRHASGILQLAGYDATGTSQRTERITLRNNLFYDIDSTKWGGNSAKAYLIGEGVADVVIDRNTLIHNNSAVVYAYGGLDMPGFVYTNNISVHGTYGIMAEGGRPGLYSIQQYFPGSRISNNVLAGGTASAYPAPSAFPTMAQWSASFANLAGGDYRLLPTSVFYAAGVNGTVPGADLGAINVAISGTTPSTEPPPVTEPTPDPAPLPSPSPGNTAPTARPGGPYSTTAGVAVRVDGSASSDPDGNIAAFRWTWGDEILVNAADVPASGIVGSRWVRTQTAGASGGVAIHNPNRAEAKRAAALAAPASYVEVKFYAAAGVPYQLWFRMRAEGDSYANDSMFVQFSGAVDAFGNTVNRIGTTSSADVILEEGSGKNVSGWGWNDAHYGALAAPVYFATTGLQTIRIQQREDGIMWDQMILSSATYRSTRPGLTRADTTIVPPTFGVTDGATASHVYATKGVFPIVLWVSDAAGAVGSAATTVTVK